MAEQAVAQEIERILERGREDEVPPTAHGECADCGRPIGAERLAAIPSAVRCITCQAAWEQGPGRR
jgi:phage/conjugal plasmid C-4 type zinc finger TraR family protein